MPSIEIAAGERDATRSGDACALAKTTGDLTIAWESDASEVPAPAISGFVSDVLASHAPPVAESTVDRVLAIVLGSRRTRFAPRPDAEGCALVRRRIAAAVAREEPVSFLTMWGAIKHYVRDEDQGVDLAELFAVLRLVQLARDVAEVHPPGAVVHVIVEDFGVWYEDAYGFPASVQSAIASGSRRYVSELIRLCEVVGGPALQAHTFGETVDVDPRECLARVERNRELLEAYWTAPPGTDAEAFDRLSRAGWRGRILEDTRAHYRARLAKLYPDEDHARHVHRICRYLAMVLLYEQLEMLRAVAPDAIRLAFYRPAPGLGRERLLGRVHLRGLPKPSCSTVMPPWTARGCLVVGDDGALRPRIESYLRLLASGSTYDRGALRIARDGREAGVRMDVVSFDRRFGRGLSLKRYGRP